MTETRLFALYLSMALAVAAVLNSGTPATMWGLFAAAACVLVASVLAWLTESSGNRARAKARADLERTNQTNKYGQPNS